MHVYKIARYGWRKDHPDHRDIKLSIAAPVPLPPSADLRSDMPPVYDQGELGSCTANAISAAVDFERKCQGEPFITPSRLFIYYDERVIEGTVSEDAGAEIRDGIKSVAAQGVCPESEWPYDITQFTKLPTSNCYTDAKKFEALTYAGVPQTANDIKHCLAILKKPVVFGFSVFESFESLTVAKTGTVPMPGKKDRPIGGHAVVIVGYDDARSMFLVRNSWGSGWGISGYFWMPYAYTLNANLADDFWVITKES